jgi:hypothetical protein
MSTTKPTSKSSIKLTSIEDARAIAASLKKPRPSGGGRKRHQRGTKKGPNKTEQAYAEYLAMLVALRQIRGYEYEPEVLDLGERCTYKPDYKVELLDGSFEQVDVKGFAEEDAIIKIKWAAKQYPHYLFVIVKKKGSGWSRREFKRGGK